MQRKPIIYSIAVTLAVFLALGFWLRKPLLYSDWDRDVAVLARVEFSPDQKSITLSGIRDWSYSTDGPLDDTNYRTQNYNLEDLRMAWFYLQPLEPLGLIAHTFIVFEFADQDNLGLSVETRRKVGQEYSLLKGAFRGFMSTHIWATETDLTTRRTDFLGYELQKYKLELTPDHLELLFRAFLAETQNLHSSPIFYNTITNNCTNSLARYINQIKPGAVPWHYSFIFTGKSVGYLQKLGYITE